jgi:5-methylcytosine-specific restriction protein A
MNDVERLYRSLWPNEADRLSVLMNFARSVETADQCGKACWEVTLFRDGLRLNAGQVEVFTVFSDWSRLLFRGDIPREAVQGIDIIQNSEPVYRAVPVPSGVCVISTEAFKSLSPEIRAAHDAFIATAASLKKRSPFKKHFSNPAMLAIENAIGRRLPRPSYLMDLEGSGVSGEQPESVDAFVPCDEDSRKVIASQIKARQGQQEFRNSLRARYGGRCQATGCEVLAVLEAAHIVPHRGLTEQHPENGLLLRSDIHTLFDLNLLGVEPRSLRIVLHPSIGNSIDYRNLAQRSLTCGGDARPYEEALTRRFDEFRIASESWSQSRDL